MQISQLVAIFSSFRLTAHFTLLGGACAIWAGRTIGGAWRESITTICFVPARMASGMLSLIVGGDIGLPSAE